MSNVYFLCIVCDVCETARVIVGGGGGGKRRTKVKRLNISLWFDTSERVVTWSQYR